MQPDVLVATVLGAGDGGLRPPDHPGVLAGVPQWRTPVGGIRSRPGPHSHPARGHRLRRRGHGLVTVDHSPTPSGMGFGRGHRHLGGLLGLALALLRVLLAQHLLREVREPRRPLRPGGRRPPDPPARPGGGLPGHPGHGDGPPRRWAGPGQSPPGDARCAMPKTPPRRCWP